MAIRSMSYSVGRQSWLPRPTVGTVVRETVGRLWLLRRSAEKQVYGLKGPTGTLLDIGCGNRKSLKKMELMGWQGEGLEFDGASAEAARQLGLKVHLGTLDELLLQKRSYEVISMIDVMEDLFDPIATLKICRRLLKPGGGLLVVTPNAASLGHGALKAAWRGLEVPRNLFLFSPESLEICLEQGGFRVTRLRTLAETARGIWCSSQAIRSNKVIPDGKSDPLDWKCKFWGQAFQWREMLACRFAPVGEELLVIAELP